jgi:hypothetical protein
LEERAERPHDDQGVERYHDGAILIRMVLRTPAHAERKKSGAALPRSAGASLVGTVVGAFFGVQVGAVGK